MQNLFVIFEGPDGTGKSTISKKLSSLLVRRNYSLIHLSLPANHMVKSIATSKNYNINPVDRQKMMMSDFLVTMCDRYSMNLGIMDIVVFDRFTPISSLAYSGDPQLVKEDVKSMMRITDELYDPLYVVYLLSNPPFRSPNSNDYFESSRIVNNTLYREAIDEFTNICRELGVHHKLVLSEIDLREIKPEQIADDIEELARAIEIVSGGFSVE